MRFNIDENQTDSTPNSPSATLQPEDLAAFVKSMEDTAKRIAELKAEMNKEMRAKFDFAVKEMFRLVPKVKTITWKQYSPYFNDGDECIFSINNISILSFIPEDVEWEYEAPTEDDFVISEYVNENETLLNAQERQVCQAVSRFINANEELMKDLYDNHVSVTITEHNTIVSECEHD